MIRRLIAASCAMLALAVPAFAGGSARSATTCWPDRVRVWRIRRVGSAPRTLDATLRFRALGARSTLLVVAAEQRAERWTSVRAWQWFEPPPGTDPVPYAYGGASAPVSTPDRPTIAPEACDRPGNYFDRPVTKPLNPTTADWFVAALTTEVTITVTSPGWTVTEVRAKAGGPDLRIYRNEDGKGAGVKAVHMSAEHFRGVSAAGGQYGSFAHAHLPCQPDSVTAGGSTGWGAATLLGGNSDSGASPVVDRYMRCDDYDFSAAAVASGPTKWTVYGEAVGETVVRNRLTVFDFPKPDRTH